MNHFARRRETQARFDPRRAFFVPRRKIFRLYWKAAAGKVAKSRKSFPHLENPLFFCGKLHSGRYSKLENFGACRLVLRAKGYFFIVLRLEKIKK
jgi:hypothetical protein